MHLVIDGDSLLYRCGFAAQKTKYLWMGAEFGSKKELDAAGYKHGSEVYDTKIVVEPVENALANAKGVMQGILDTTGSSDYTLYLSSNMPTFRDALAKIKPYKGNRPEGGKPHHYNAIKKYLIDVWNAEEVFGVETDDECAIAHTVDETIIVSNDKDLKQIAGHHYNWTKAEEGVTYVTEDAARFNKYCQILSGDATDNVEGIPGLGDSRATRMLLHCLGDSEEDFDAITRDIYHLYFTTDKNIKHLGMSYIDYVYRLGMTIDQIYEENKALITLITNEQDKQTVCTRWGV